MVDITDLVAEYEAAKEHQDRWKEEADRLVLNIKREMETDKAEVWYDVDPESGEIRGKLTTEYEAPTVDRSILPQLREFVPEAVLVGTNAYTPEITVTVPEHEETTPASWNMTHAKPLGRLNAGAAEVIARATMPGKFKGLKIERPEAEPKKETKA